MSLIKRSSIDVLDQERAFAIDELFFSITDKKGIILQGNDVFTRISAYSFEEIIGAPHSILRHPDMPRSVFQLLWKTIEAGQAIAAYVKNLAKDGRYYWVLALVMPTDKGYLSIRLKPTSPLLPVVQSIYADMLRVERLIETEPKRRVEAMTASSRRMGELLQRHGFADYTSFMQTALSTEMVSRQKTLASQERNQRTPPVVAIFDHATAERLRVVAGHCADLDRELLKLFEYLDEFRSMNVLLLDKSRSMLENAAVIRLLSLNATVAASRLGTRAQTLGVVAESLGDASVNSEQVINQMSKEMDKLVSVLSSLIFEVANIKLQSEVSNYFLKELMMGISAGSEEDVIGSLMTLIHEVSRRTTAVYDQLSESENCFALLRKRVEQLLRNVNTLRFVQFAGLKESVALEGARAFQVVFEDARTQIDKTRDECDQLRQRVETNQKHIHAIRNARSEVLSHIGSLLAWAAAW